MDISNNTQHIRQAIEAMRKEHKLKKGLEKAQVMKTWEALMSETIAKFTANIQYNNGTLTVYLTSSALREELNRGKNNIITLMNEHYGKNVITKIIFK